MGFAPLKTLINVATDFTTLCALSTVGVVDVYTAFRAHEGQLRARLGRRGESTSTTATERFVAAHEQSLEGTWVYVLPAMAACTLITLFFLLQSVGVIVTLCSAIASCVGVAFVLLPIGTWLSRRLNRSDELAGAIVTPFAIVVVLMWTLTGNWFLNNVLGVALCVLFGAVYRVDSFRSLVILFVGLFIYDVFFVFFSAKFFGKNVMFEVATSSTNNPASVLASWLHLPFHPVQNLSLLAKLIFPDGSGTYSFLGLGDIFLPIILLVYLLQVDLSLDDDRIYSGLFIRGVVAHLLGLLLSFFCNVAFQAVQPALFYIIPLMLSVTVYTARKKRLLSAMWNGNSTRRAYQELRDCIESDSTS